jgi:hypothetical protein
MLLFKRLATLSGLLGLALGAAMMCMAWRHNPQCEIHCGELGISWGYWLLIGASWLVVGFLLSLLVLGVIARVGRALWPNQSFKRTR